MTAKTKTAHRAIARRCAQVLALLCTCPMPLCAQSGTTQTVVPRQVFTGDSVCASYSFESDVDFFEIANPDLFDQDGSQHGRTDRLDFAFLGEGILENPSDALVQECTLTKSKNTWTFSVTMIPWQAGLVRFKAIDLQELCTRGRVSAMQEAGGDSCIALEPVEVLSVSKRRGESSFRGIKEPLLPPSARRTLRFVLIAAITASAATLLLCRHRIARSIKTLIMQACYKHNAHVTQKRLLRLIKAPLSDRATCQRWLQTMKAYLSVRFGRDFTQTASQDVSKEIFDATGGLLTGQREQAADDLALLFVRASYIAQAARAGEGKRFASGEKESFLFRTLKVIDTFEFLGDEGESDEYTSGECEGVEL